jgi:hypothetical protein
MRKRKKKKKKEKVKSRGSDNTCFSSNVMWGSKETWTG